MKVIKPIDTSLPASDFSGAGVGVLHNISNDFASQTEAVPLTSGPGHKVRRRFPRSSIYLFLGILAAGQGTSAAQEIFPQTLLANRRMELRILLPDEVKGFYRGTRFDWSGQMLSVTCDGHSFFEPWRFPHNPLLHDAASGPAEEFGMFSPLGYEEARPGETFLKIGVGFLKKPEEKEYGFYRDYQREGSAPWTISKEPDALIFQQTIADKRGWGYRYTKRITLQPDGFRMARTLENTGTRSISTDHYGHNFVRINHAPVGPAYQLRFPFAPGVRMARPDPVTITGRVLQMPEVTDSFYAELTGFQGKEDHAATVTHVPTGLAVEIRGDRPPIKFNVYAEKTALCPEAFVQLEIAPGGEAHWASQYQFHIPQPKH